MAKFKRGNLDLLTNQKIRLGNSLESIIEFNGSQLKISDSSGIRIDANGAENFMLVTDAYIQMYTNSSAQGSNYEMLRIDKDAEIMYIGSPVGGVHLRYLYDSDPVWAAYSGTTRVFSIGDSGQTMGPGSNVGPQVSTVVSGGSDGNYIEATQASGGTYNRGVLWAQTGDDGVFHTEVHLGGRDNFQRVTLDRNDDTVYIQTEGGETNTGVTMLFDGTANTHSVAILGTDVMNLEETQQSIGVTGTETNIVVSQANDNISMYMDAGEGQGYKQVMDVDGDAGASEINIGLQTEVYLKIQIGSGPNIRIMSGTDVWFYVDPDDQRLGNSGDVGSYINVNTNDNIIAYSQGVQVMDLDYNEGVGVLQFGTSATQFQVDLDSTELLGRVNSTKVFGFEEGLQRIGLSSDENIIIDQSNNVVKTSIEGNEILTVDSTGIVVTGDITCDDLYVSNDTIFVGTGEIKSTAGNIELNYGGTKVFEIIEDGIKIEANSNELSFVHDGTSASITTSLISPSDLVIDCGTEKTVKLEEGVWKDINLSSALLTGPTSGQPDTDTFMDEGGGDTGIDTFAFAVGEKVHGVFEIQHDYKEGTDIYFHIHWQGIAAPTGTDNVNWQISYTISSTNSTLDTIRTITTGDDSFDTQYEFKNTEFGVIDGQTGGNNGGPIQIGDQMLFTLERIASVGDAYAGDALLATVGIHYEVDTIGSRQKTSKG